MVVHPAGVGSGVSRASALPMAGLAAMTTIWPACRPLVSESRSLNPVGTPVIAPPREPIASISSSAPGMMSASGEVVLADPAVGDAVDLGLGAVHQLVGVAVARVAELHDPGAGLDQAAQDRALPDDPGVVAGVGRGRHRREQRVQVGAAADAGQLAALGRAGR